MFLRSKMLYNQRKTLNRWFDTPLLKIIVLLTIFFLIPNVSLALAPFSDDFEDYTLNYLTGQGSWTSQTPYGSWVVNETSAKSGTQSINCPTGYCGNRKIGSGLATGKWVFYTKVGVSKDIGFWIEQSGSPACRVDISATTNTIKFIGASTFDTGWPVIPDEWVPLQIEWDETIEKCRIKYGESEWSDWLTAYASFSQVNALYIFSTASISGTRFVDFISDEPILETGEIVIVSPVSGSEMTEAFDVEGTYDFKEGDWEKIMIIFEQWDASSTCPIFDTPEWNEEYYDYGWFIYQSMPFFTNFLNATSGEFLIKVNDLRLGNYNCVRCYFFNETESTISPEKCPNYNLKITDEIVFPVLPSTKFPFKTWETYYSEESEQFATSTSLFSGIAQSLFPVIDKLGDFVLYIKTYFNPDEAMAKGTELGQAIPKARGYLTLIDGFFGELPISSFFIFFLLTLAVIISYKVILQILKIIKP